MKIAQIMLAKSFGGAERYFVDLCRSLSREGHEVMAICHHNSKAYNLLAGEREISVAPISVMGWWDLFAVKKVRRLLLEFDPDAIQAHLARAAYITGKAAKDLNKPLLAKTHNYVDLKYYRDVDMYIPTTNDQKEYLIQQGVDAGRIRVIPNFSSIQPVANVPEPGSNTNLVSYGRLVKKKGFDVLLRAFKKAGAKDRDIRLFIGGDGVEGPPLKTLAEELAITDRIIFTGWVEDVRTFLLNGDIFILPSLDEPFGIAVLEAMACGKPIITTATKGPLEILDNESAYIVPVNDVDSLGKAIITAVENRQQCLEKASAGLELYRSTYADNVVVPRLVSLYRELAG